MTVQEQELYEILKHQNVTYQRVEHPPLFTCQDEEKYAPEIPGIKTKNLFLRNNKGNRHFLVSIPHSKSANLKSLEAELDCGRLGFASPQRLEKHLGVKPGSVTMLALINDKELAVEFFIDEAIATSQRICCHPLTNTATLSIATNDMKKFIASTGHEIKILSQNQTIEIAPGD